MHEVQGGGKVNALQGDLSTTKILMHTDVHVLRGYYRNVNIYGVCYHVCIYDGFPLLNHCSGVFPFIFDSQSICKGVSV